MSGLTELNSETKWDLKRFGRSQPRHKLSSVIARIQLAFFELSLSFVAANRQTISDLLLPGGEALRSGGDCRLAALNCRRSTMYDPRAGMSLFSK
jgi:hypothetical protein